MKPHLYILASVVLFALPLKNVCQAQDIPAEMKATFYSKMFTLVQNLDTPHVSIIYAEKHAKQKDKLAEAFEKAGIQVTSFNDRDASNADGNIIYLMSGISDDAARHFSACGTLVLADSRAFLEAGYATFVLSPVKGKITLWANLTHLKSNNVSVNHSVLKAAKTVG